MKRGFWIRKIAMGVVIGAAAVFLFGLILMNLWNAILPAVIHVSAITFWQAIGILLLSKILFGGFRGGWGGGGRRAQWKEKMQNKWKEMTPEQRDQFKQDWRNRCATWRRPAQEQQSAEQQ
jgi:Ca2+/H+ antiporter, TMEM165/GDT1 family